MPALSVAHIREQDLVIGKMTPEQERVLVAKHLLLWDGDAAFWRDRLTSGKENFDALVGNIFTEPEKQEFRAQDKILLQIPELVPKMNALEGMQIAGRRQGVIIPVGGEDAPDTEIIGHLVKDVQRKNHLDMELTASFTAALVAGYPSCIFFDRPGPHDQNKKLDVYNENWDAVLFDPTFSRRDYSDATRLTRIKLMDRNQLIQSFPKRRKQIEADIRIGNIADALFAENAFNAGERDVLFNQLTSAGDLFSRTGLTYVVERQHFVYVMTTVWASPYTDKVEILPAEWDQATVNRWKEFHPDYQSVEQEMKVLWVTTTTASGLLLENDRHWFQEGEFAAEIFVPRMWNNKIYGVVEFLKGSLKGRNVTKIEHLHSLRMANDDLMVTKEGALVNPADAAREKARVGGILVVSRNADPERDIRFPLNQREQLGWADMSETFLMDLDRLSVDRNFEGGVQSSQESGRAIERRISQTQVKYSPYLSAINLTDLRVTRKILLMIPYIWTEHEIFRYVDPKNGQLKQVAFNEPQAYSWVGEGVQSVKNNLCGARYDYVEAEGDNSATAQEHELVVFNEIMEQLGRLPDPSLWPFLLTSVPNRMAQEFGRKLQEHFDAQAQAGAQPEKMKKSLNIKGEDLLFNPRVIEILVQEGILPPGTIPTAPGAANPQAGSSSMPQGRPGTSPSPQMAMSAQ